MKKFLSVFISLVMIFSLFTVAFAADEDGTLNYLLLGDSIAFGAGVLNSDEACYGRIVADTNGYNYKNDAINGSTISDLQKTIQKESVIEDIKNADIISISIGGNDFIRSPLFIPVILTAAFGYMGLVDGILDDFYPTYCEVIDTIREINPDATILMQTLYNPRVILFRQAFARGVSALNDCYRRYLADNPGAFTIVDLYEELDSETGFIAIDTIHPNAKGNKLIAGIILQYLYDLGLGENTTPVINSEPVDEIYLPVWEIYRILT